MDISMNIVMWALAGLYYICLGIAANEVYTDRDLELSRIAYCLAIGAGNLATVNKTSIDAAGWFFWRRKWLFNRMSWNIKYVIGILIWPLDLIFAEIGYAREIECLKRLNAESLSVEGARLRYVRI